MKRTSLTTYFRMSFSCFDDLLGRITMDFSCLVFSLDKVRSHSSDPDVLTDRLLRLTVKKYWPDKWKRALTDVLPIRWQCINLFDLLQPMANGHIGTYVYIPRCIFVGIFVVRHKHFSSVPVFRRTRLANKLFKKYLSYYLACA